MTPETWHILALAIDFCAVLVIMFAIITLAQLIRWLW